MCFLKTSKSEDTQLLIFREFIDILENIGKFMFDDMGPSKLLFIFSLDVNAFVCSQ